MLVEKHDLLVLAHMIDKRAPKSALSIISFNEKMNKSNAKIKKENLSVKDNTYLNIETLMVTTHIPAKIVSLEFYQELSYLCVGFSNGFVEVLKLQTVKNEASTYGPG